MTFQNTSLYFLQTGKREKIPNLNGGKDTI